MKEKKYKIILILISLLFIILGIIVFPKAIFPLMIGIFLFIIALIDFIKR